MKHVYLYPIAFILLTLQPLAVSAQDASVNTKKQRQHGLYLAVGSPALFLSLNYETSLEEFANFTFHSRVGFGINPFKPSFGKEFNLSTGLVALYGKKKHKAEATLGLVHDFYPTYNPAENRSTLKYKAIIYTGLGYRFQPQHHAPIAKFLITPTFTINADKIVFFPYVELGAGYIFGSKCN